MPLADAARRPDVSCGKRPAALPPAHGASPRLSGQTLGGLKVDPRQADATSPPQWCLLMEIGDRSRCELWSASKTWNGML